MLSYVDNSDQKCRHFLIKWILSSPVWFVQTSKARIQAAKMRGNGKPEYLLCSGSWRRGNDKRNERIFDSPGSSYFDKVSEEQKFARNTTIKQPNKRVPYNNRWCCHSFYSLVISEADLLMQHSSCDHSRRLLNIQDFSCCDHSRRLLNIQDFFVVTSGPN